MLIMRSLTVGPGALYELPTCDCVPYVAPCPHPATVVSIWKPLQMGLAIQTASVKTQDEYRN